MSYLSEQKTLLDKICTRKGHLSYITEVVIPFLVWTVVGNGGETPAWGGFMILFSGRQGGQQRAHPAPAFSSCLQLKIILMPEWHILGWCILTSYSLICHPERNICCFFPQGWWNMLPALTSWRRVLKVEFIYRQRTSDNLGRWTSILEKLKSRCHWVSYGKCKVLGVSFFNSYLKVLALICFLLFNFVGVGCFDDTL